jgi:histidine triad (HIT) family protein
MSRDNACVFCRIVAAEIPSAVVYEDDAVLAFLDIGPLAEGHLLVIPRDHYRDLSDMPPDSCAKLAEAIPTLARALLRVTKADGFNVLCNQGRAAGQLVAHVHFHLIPRREGDGLGYRWNAGKYPAGRSEHVAAEYQRALAHPH